ncbi:MAG: hypothetical protein QM495_12245 [Lutibacter sp.]|uniref:hypothetical protein n=1 Tax=Lutibacter sp. TaxID=1925666 RepID=UPI00385D8E9E
MYKKLSLIFALSFTLISFGQEEIKGFKNYLKTSFTGIKEVIPIVNEKNNDISLFIVDATKIYGYLLNEQFEIINQLSSETRSRKYKTLIGNSISEGNDYRVYLANTKRTKFASINFSYNKQNSNFKEFSLESKDEKFIQTATYNNKFYLFSVIKNTSIIKIYSFDDEANYVVTKVDFSKDRFINRENKKALLYHLLTFSTGAYGLTKSVDIHKIDKNSPNSIEVTSNFRKLYLNDSKIIFSFDQNKNFTQVIVIDLISFKKEVKRFKKPFNEIQSVSKKTNTYISENNIYIISSTNEKFTFIIQDFNTGSLIKEYSATVNDSITFKNTPIIQKGGAYDAYRELEKTRKFLRKITTGKIGISTYKINNNYQITLGSKLDQATGGMMMPMGGIGTIPIASVGNVSVFFNPTYFAYNSYSNTKSTYIKCLFDLEFNHVKGEIKENAFDKIKYFKEKDHYFPKGKTVFKYKDYYILGNYFSGSKSYRLRKFED